jgi:hypothetical protein
MKTLPIRIAMALGQLTLFSSMSQSAQAAAFVGTGAMSVARYNHSATLLPDGKVLVAGGDTDVCGGFVSPTSSAELYDPATGTWAMTGAMVAAREVHTATLLPSGKVLVTGGDGDTAPTTLSSAELYNPATGTWSATGSMTVGRDSHTAALLPSGKVLVAGGYNPQVIYGNGLSSAEFFDPATETWTATGSLGEGRFDHTATLLPNGKVLVAGGWDYNDMLSTAELYDPSTGIWAPTGSLISAPGVGTATLLLNGKVLVAKGWVPRDPGRGWDPVGQLYAPDIGTWAATPPLSIGGEYHSASLLPDGKVLIAGGYAPGGAYLYNSDLYDPTSGTWASTGSLGTARKNHTATRLADGRVLVAGGYQGCWVLPDCELYNSTNEPVAPIILTNVAKLSSGWVAFTFNSSPGALVRVLATTNPLLPLDQWTVLTGVAEMTPGWFQFVDMNATSFGQRFYRAVCCP